MSNNSMAQYNGGTAWTRYTDYFLKQQGYDTTGIAMSIHGLGSFTCTLISNRHVLLARHVGKNITLGTNVYFVNDSNVTFTYQISTMQTIGEEMVNNSAGAGYTDISIGYLNQPVDATLRFVKVVPANFLDYLQTSFIFNELDENDNEILDLNLPFISPALPVFYNTNGYYSDPASGAPRTAANGSTDTWRRTWCGTLKFKFSLGGQPTAGGSFGAFLKYVYPVTGAKYSNSDEIRSGDSGNIVFIPINNEIVILGTWYTGSGNDEVKAPGSSIGTTSFIAPRITEINSAMTALAGGTSYSLTQATLSGFKTF